MRHKIVCKFSKYVYEPGDDCDVIRHGLPAGVLKLGDRVFFPGPSLSIYSVTGLNVSPVGYFRRYSVILTPNPSPALLPHAFVQGLVLPDGTPVCDETVELTCTRHGSKTLAFASQLAYEFDRDAIEDEAEEFKRGN